ncbi:hypothetical protein [Anaeroselena agilis]|uniref:Uncharacterized protein n=1 Tax=Anaeroselena agilis TaxID=3063788 RepID=A0ABU3NTA6_9FIRM|nr:hypothetical protein [Selenomonadales bacterium 4137-cl]
MKEGVEVGICGTGPVWAGIEESLQKLPGLRVRQLGSSLAVAAREVAMLSPHAVLFDMDKAEPDVVAAILRKLPGTRLIGFNAAGDAITVFAASERTVLSVEELAGVIAGGARTPEAIR